MTHGSWTCIKRKNIVHGKFFIFVHKNVYRIRSQEFKIGSLEGFDKKALILGKQEAHCNLGLANKIGTFLGPRPGLGPGPGGQPWWYANDKRIYDLHGLNHQIIEKSWDVKPVTHWHTCESRAVFCLGRIRKERISSTRLTFNNHKISIHQMFLLLCLTKFCTAAIYSSSSSLVLVLRVLLL